MVSNVIDMVNPEPKRLYKIWKGKNKFFCGGRCIFGPDVSSLFLSMLLIAGPALVFCVQIFIKIINHSTVDSKEEADKDSQVLGVPALIVALFITIVDMVFLLLTSSRDPGIVPRNACPPESDEAFDVTTQWINGTAPHLKLPRTKDITVNGFTVKVKYCDTCLLYRPARASHCSICNNCVQKFDHHCPWVGQCIGLRNYRFFFMFISSSTFLCMYVHTFSWMNVIEEKRKYNLSLTKSLRDEVLSLVLIVYTFIGVWFVGGLTVFHTYLISTNQTTYENFRYRYDKKENPYTKGILGNFTEVFFSKIPPSMNNFRSWVLEDSLEVGSVSTNTGLAVYVPKNKIDLEIGRNPEPGYKRPSLPNILQDLDYSSIDDNTKKTDSRQEDDEVGPFSFPILQEHSVPGPRGSSQCCIASDARVADAGDSDDEGIISSGIILAPKHMPQT